MSKNTTGPAAIRANFINMKSVLSRNVAQIILEVPLEEADHALTVLGGWPLPGSDRWVGVARLVEQPKAIPDKREPEPEPEPEEKPKKGPPSRTQMAGILCNDPKFWGFLEAVGSGGSVNVKDADDAVAFVYEYCEIGSRKELAENEEAQARWDELILAWEVYTGRRGSPELQGDPVDDGMGF